MQAGRGYKGADNIAQSRTCAGAPISVGCARWSPRLPILAIVIADNCAGPALPARLYSLRSPSPVTHSKFRQWSFVAAEQV